MGQVKWRALTPDIRHANVEIDHEFRMSVVSIEICGRFWEVMLQIGKVRGEVDAEPADTVKDRAEKAAKHAAALLLIEALESLNVDAKKS